MLSDKNRLRLIRAYSPGVEHVVSVGLPSHRFRLIANKHGKIVTAFGPITVSSLDMSYPGCASADEIEVADAALVRAGATRGNSPAGRALDYALRTKPELAQWRVKLEFLDVFTKSLFGGAQFGGQQKPIPAPNVIGMDIISSYPYLATQRLPRVREVVFERGYKSNAVLIEIEAEQNAPALFCRSDDGTTEYAERVSGWYVAEEVFYHVEHGRVKLHAILNCCTFTRFEKFLAPAVDHFFTHRERYRRGAIERTIIKSALNGLLGKFAAPISPWRTPKKGELEELTYTRARTTLRLGKSALVLDPNLIGIYPRHSNVIWTALTNARARVRLWEKMDEINRAGGKVLWAHTDAVIARVPENYPRPNGAALGEWRETTPELIGDSKGNGNDPQRQDDGAA